VIFLSIGGIIAGLIAARFIVKLGRDRFITFSVAGLAAGVLLYTAPGGIILTLSGSFTASFFGSAIIVGASAFLFDHQKEAGPASITEANAVAALSGALAPIAVGLVWQFFWAGELDYGLRSLVYWSVCSSCEITFPCSACRSKNRFERPKKSHSPGDFGGH
jgi:MFS family permease